MLLPLPNVHVKNASYLHVTRPPVQVQVHVLDFAVLAEHILNIFLRRLLMHIGDDDDPAFNATDRDRIACRFGVAVGLGADLTRFGRGRRVDLHLGIGHDA